MTRLRTVIGRTAPSPPRAQQHRRPGRLELGIGLAPVLAPALLAKLPPQLGFLTGNTILLTAVVAVVLNIVLNNAWLTTAGEARSRARP